MLHLCSAPLMQYPTNTVHNPSTNEARTRQFTITAKLPTTLLNQEVIILDKEDTWFERGVQEPSGNELKSQP